MVQFVNQMTAVDVIFIVIWLAFIAYAVYSGFLRQILLLGSIVIGLFLASAVSIPLTDILNLMLHGPRADLLPFVYSFLVVLLSVLFDVLTHMAFSGNLVSRFRTADRVLAGLVGVVVGLVVVMELWAMLTVMTASPWAILDGARSSLRLQIESTPFLPLLADTFSFVKSGIDRLVPQP
ncbi:MAG: hypothetical protein QOF51_1813 [Chloroflexota bacterium]|nr:hypothetical protein [Chloroflexota bacterium]